MTLYARDTFVCLSPSEWDNMLSAIHRVVECGIVISKVKAADIAKFVDIVWQTCEAVCFST